MQYLVHIINRVNREGMISFNFYKTCETYERATIEAMKLNQNFLVTTNTPLDNDNKVEKDLLRVYFRTNEFYIETSPGNERNAISNIFGSCVKLIVFKS